MVTGAISGTYVEDTAVKITRCTPGASATAPLTGTIPFGVGDPSFDLQLVSVPRGRSDFGGGKAAVSFYNGVVSAQQWGAGLTKAAGNGSVTLAADGKTGFINATLVQAAPAGSAAMGPIHISGSFSC